MLEDEGAGRLNTEETELMWEGRQKEDIKGKVVYLSELSQCLSV